MILEADNGARFTRVSVADSYFTRLRGLLGRRSLESGEGLLLKSCPSIHCFFMKFTIDVVYIDENGVIVGIETVKPWHIGGSFSGARHVLELAEGGASQLSVGDCFIYDFNGRKTYGRE